MAQQTVREQMAETLGEWAEVFGCTPPAFMDKFTAQRLKLTQLALERHRTEPGEGTGHCGCNFPNCDCPCFQAGYQDGLEAQREPPGRGTS